MRLLQLGLLAGASSLLLRPAPAAIPEPDSLFYGRVINRSSGQAFLLTEGSLAWTFRQPDGSVLTLSGSLEPFPQGDVSYRLKVPHHALSLGLSVSAQSVPLAITPLEFPFGDILVNGWPARVLPPAQDRLAATQQDRGATHRIDLEVFDPLLDSDGDGIPDWWEELHQADDPNADADGDGLSNRAEFDQGSDPDKDDRRPSLADVEFLAYADGASGLALRAIDIDSPPEALVYTLLSAPASGTLFLNAADVGNTELLAGAVFSQADVDLGRLVYVHGGSQAPADNDRFDISLRDEDPAHEAFQSVIRLLLYRPLQAFSEGESDAMLAGLPRRLPHWPNLSPDLSLMTASYLLSRDRGHVVQDLRLKSLDQVLATPSSGWAAEAYAAGFIPQFGPDHSHVLVGGAGNDHLLGGMEGDLLAGQRGDDRLVGGGGPDLFLLGEPGDGNDVIGDFRAADNDTLDLSSAFQGGSANLNDYLRVTLVAEGTRLGLDAQGDGGGYTDRIITLEGVSWNQEDLYAMVESGQLQTGGLVLPARVTLVASTPVASENGSVPGTFTLQRSGSLEGAITVNLLLTGSAINGVDYAWVTSLHTMAEGVSSLDIPVIPYPDGLTELSEVVEAVILSGTGYEIGAASRAQVLIEDLAPRLTIEALDRSAVRDPLRPGYLLISRSGVLDRSVFVRLSVSGTASSTTDYEALPGFLSLAAFETSRLLEIRPRAGAVLNNGAESVLVQLNTDPGYRLGDPTLAGLMIVDRELTFEEWMHQAFPAVTDDPASFAGGDQGNAGVLNLHRYAFQLDPLDPSGNGDSLPRFEVVEGHLSVSFRDRAALTDLQFQVEVSTDLQLWHSGPGHVETWAGQGSATDLETRFFRAVNSLHTDPHLYMRVRVLYAP